MIVLKPPPFGEEYIVNGASPSRILISTNVDCGSRIAIFWSSSRCTIDADKDIESPGFRFNLFSKIGIEGNVKSSIVSTRHINRLSKAHARCCKLIAGPDTCSPSSCIFSEGIHWPCNHSCGAPKLIANEISIRNASSPSDSVETESGTTGVFTVDERVPFNG